MTTTAFTLREFGVPALEQPDGTVVQRGGKQLAVLIWLAHAGARRYSREELCELFWPTDPPQNARKSLRQALSVHRRWLGEAQLCTDDDLVWVRDGAISRESQRLREAARAGDWDTAMACVRGPWLQGTEFAGGPRFERWVLSEREALALEFADVVTRQVAACTAAGDLDTAWAVARVGHDLAPRFEPLVVLSVDTLVALGEFAEARALLIHFTNELAQDGDVASERIRRLQRRLATTARDGTGLAPAATQLGDRLVGRDAEMAIVQRALGRARQHQMQRLVVSGTAGMGKTRLLDEIDARLRTQSVQLVRVRLAPEMHDVAGAALTEYVRALASLGGAAGVSAPTAAVLTGLVPDLTAAFPGVTPAAAPARPDVLYEAVADLLQAVTEERLTVVLLDDAHHLDALSRDVWHRLGTRTAAALLEVATTRERDAVPHSTRLLLAPLVAGDIHELLDEAATLPDAPWRAPLLAALTTASAGAPGPLLRGLRTLDLRGHLRVQDGGWRVASPAAVTADIAQAFREARSPGSGEAAHLLAVLHVWGRPLTQSDLMTVAAARWRDVTPDEWRAGLRGLEREGFAVTRAGEWTAVDSAIAGAPDPDTAVPLLTALAVQLLRDEAPPMGTIEHLMRRAGAMDAFPVAATVIRRVARKPSVRDAGLRGRALARRCASVSGRPEWEPRLYRAIGFVGRRSRPALIALGALAASLVVVAGTLTALWQPRLAVEAAPMAMAGLQGAVGLVVQPRVAVYDGFGRRRDDLAMTVRVSGERTRVVGDTTRPTDAGRAQFERLALVPMRPDADAASEGRPPQLVFRGPWWVRAARVDVAGVRWAGGRDQFRVVRAAVNGRALDGRQIARVRTSDDSVRVTLTFEFSTDNATANYVVGAGPTWLPHGESVVRVAGLPRPVVNAWQTVRFAVPTPRTPGRHYVILAMGTEDSVDHLFSATNWAVGAPVWDDGNDLQSLTPARRAFLRDSGWVVQPRALTGRYRRAEGALAIGDSAWRVGVGDYATTGDLLIQGTVFEIAVNE
ncbi:MAG: AAA family ATPase [Gemmatimonadota bacterium]|nr:AAA family ATPase [Gemmatimonadota bacterium]MDQ8171508.1 AAA family ATPase [Gemmatimonadota bacterium]